MPKKLDSKKTNPAGGESSSIASWDNKIAAARIVEKAKSDTLAKVTKNSSSFCPPPRTILRSL